MKGIKRPQIVLGQESIRQRKDSFRIESQQGDRTVIAAVSIEAIQKQAGLPHPPSSGCGRHSTREFKPCEFRGDDGFLAFEQTRSQLRVLGFIGKVGTNKGTRFRVEKAQLAARSSMSA